MMFHNNWTSTTTQQFPPNEILMPHCLYCHCHYFVHAGSVHSTYIPTGQSQCLQAGVLKLVLLYWWGWPGWPSVGQNRSVQRAGMKCWSGNTCGTLSINSGIYSSWCHLAYSVSVWGYFKALPKGGTGFSYWHAPGYRYRSLDYWSGVFKIIVRGAGSLLASNILI